MATEIALRRCRAWYARLLRLYPSAFRQRFGEGMAQTFADLCRESQNAGRPVVIVLIWACIETSLSIVKEHAAHIGKHPMTQRSSSVFKTVRVVAIVVSALMIAGIATVMGLARGTGEDITGVVAPALLVTIVSAIVAVVATLAHRRERHGIGQ